MSHEKLIALASRAGEGRWWIRCASPPARFHQMPPFSHSTNRLINHDRAAIPHCNIRRVAVVVSSLVDRSTRQSTFASFAVVAAAVYDGSDATADDDDGQANPPVNYINTPIFKNQWNEKPAAQIYNIPPTHQIRVHWLIQPEHSRKEEVGDFLSARLPSSRHRHRSGPPPGQSTVINSPKAIFNLYATTIWLILLLRLSVEI